jgi:hypothetical protein
MNCSDRQGEHLPISILSKLLISAAIFEGFVSKRYALRRVARNVIFDERLID